MVMGQQRATMMLKIFWELRGSSHQKTTGHRTLRSTSLPIGTKFRMKNPEARYTAKSTYTSVQTKTNGVGSYFSMVMEI